MRLAPAWYESFVVDEASSLLGRLDALNSAGLALQHHPPPGPRRPGLVFFDTLSRELKDFFLEASGDGDARVLAVATSGRGVAADEAWSVLDMGASDLIVWDDDAPSVAAEIAARFDRWAAIDGLIESPLVRTNLIGSARAWRAALRQVVEVARFSDASVLVLGETGTGKELIARLIHALDARPHKGDLIVLDCTTVVPDLAGSEFFGHERGAFTGAAGSREGAFALADGGTLFLDEIGDLPLPLQAQLLRAIQERTYKPVGGNTWRATRFRLVCATHRRLGEDVAAGTFRADLYYRLGAVVCRLPPLRERPEDIIMMFRHFVALYAGRRELPDLADPVRDLLLQRPYCGNVRELQQLARRTASRHVGPGPITVGDIPDDERPRGGEPAADLPSLESAIRRELARGSGLKAISRAAAAAAIRLALGEANGNLHLAARRLGVTDRALQMRRAASSLRGGGRRTA